MPNTNPAPQSTWTGTVKTENNTKKGPGQSPPIPHPNPKRAAPPISCQSTRLFLGSNTLHPLRLVPFFLIIVKVIVLTNSPHPRTNIKAGFHLSLICKNCKMLILLDIPDIMSPMAKMRPTKKTISWSFSWAQDLNWSTLFLATIKPTIGINSPITKKQIAEMVWLYVI